MLDKHGIHRCDAEIGSVANGWTTCRKIAVCESRTDVGVDVPGIYLDWCATHRGRATDGRRTLVREYQTEAVT